MMMQVAFNVAQYLSIYDTFLKTIIYSNMALKL